MPLTVTGAAAHPRVFGRLVAENGRRSIAQKLRRQGERAHSLQVAYSSELGPSRRGKRRRDGTSYRNSHQPAEYTGLEDFSSGIMEITLRNTSKHAGVIEVGGKTHQIDPHGNYPMRWPPNNVSGKPTVVAWHVEKSHSKAFHILKRSAIDAMSQGFVGQSMGHAVITFRVSR